MIKMFLKLDFKKLKALYSLKVLQGLPLHHVQSDVIPLDGTLSECVVNDSQLLPLIKLEISLQN